MWESDPFFLFIQPAVTRLYRWRKGLPVWLADFTSDAAGLADFARWRKEARHAPLTILADLPDEGFVLETIPRLTGAERRAVIARKLRQHFPDTPYVATQTLPGKTGEPKTPKRKEETLLFAALPATPLQDWITRAEPIAGLYALPQLFPAAIEQFHLPQDCILLTRQRDSLRQTWMRAGVACFSRVLSLSLDSLRDETRRLFAYLARQSFSPASADLPLCPLFALSEDERALLMAEFVVKPDVVVDDAFFLSLLAKSPPQTQYAPEPLIQSARLPKLKRFILAVGACCLVVGVAFAAYAMREASTLRQQRAILLEEAEGIRASLPVAEEENLPFDVERAKSLLSAFPDKPPATMQEDLQALSRLLEGFPALRLERLDWEAEGRMVLELRVTVKDEARLRPALRRAAQMQGFKEARMENVPADRDEDRLMRWILTRD